MSLYVAVCVVGRVYCRRIRVRVPMRVRMPVRMCLIVVGVIGVAW